MKVALLSTFFFFASIFGRTTSDNEENISLALNIMRCTKDGDCSRNHGWNSKCKRNICVCLTNIKWEQCRLEKAFAPQPRSYHGPSVGDWCKSDQKCRFPHAFCNIGKQECDCMKGYIPARDHTRCLRIAENLYEACVESAQCQANFAKSMCSNQMCECKDYHHQSERQCWMTAKFGEPCEDTRECLFLLGHCDETQKICVCEGNTAINARKTECFDMIGYKGRDHRSCYESGQCEHLGPTYCDIHGDCVCLVDYHYNERLNLCKLDLVYGDACEHDDDCYDSRDYAGVSLMCDQLKKTCNCRKGFELVTYSETKRCKKMFNVGAVDHPTTLIILVTFFLISF